MSKLIGLAAAAATVTAMSFAAAPAAEAGHRYHHGVSFSFFRTHGPFYGQNYRPVGTFHAAGIYYMPHGYRGEPFCRQWAWVYTRSGKQKWRCLDW